MAALGVRVVEELIGRADLLEADEAIEHWKARGVDLTHVLARPAASATARRAAASQPPPPVLGDALDWTLIEQAAARDRPRGEPRHAATFEDPQRQPLRRRHALRARRRGARRRQGCRADTIRVDAARLGRAVFGGWLAPGVELRRCSATPTTTRARASPAACSPSCRPTDVDVRRRGERHHRQHRALRRHRRPRVLPRPRGRALRGAQLGRQRGRRGRRRPRLRVHDRRPRGRPRRDRAQLRRGHERRRGVRARRGRHVPRARVQPGDARQLEAIDEADAIELRALVEEHVRAHRLAGRAARSSTSGTRCCRSS